MAGNYVYVDDATSASGSQGPGPLPDNAYDRALSPGITASYFKSPNAVYFNSAPTLPVGFWFGSRETFDGLTNNYMNFMIKNGKATESFFKGTFLGEDLNYCNEIRAAIETTISETKKIE